MSKLGPPGIGSRRSLGWIAVVLAGLVTSAALILPSGRPAASATYNPTKTGLTVWMQPIASPAELSAVSLRLKHWRGVGVCTYRNQEANYLTAKRVLTRHELSHLTVRIMPTFFSCNTNSVTTTRRVSNAIARMPGVMRVNQDGI
jgi:hypothetical protein